MKNNFINNNGANLHNTKNKKTKIESRIEELKNQEQAIITELESWETKNEKANNYLNSLSEIERFSTKFLAEQEKAEKDKENFDNWWLEYLIKDKIEFTLKFEPAKEAFTNLICQKIANQVSYLKSQLQDNNDILYSQLISANG